MGYNKPLFTELITQEICQYGCNNIAKFRFSNGKLCCSNHFNSCPGKRQTFSKRTDHKETASKSLETRKRLGITKSSQIKATATRKANGHYEMLAAKMQQHWQDSPWQNNPHCLLVPYKSTHINYQGSYEFKFLEQLELEYSLNWIVENVNRGPTIHYIDPSNNKARVYFSDFIIGNDLYEIKSNWTWNKHGSDLVLEEKNRAKLTAARDAGYNVILVLETERLSYERIMGRSV